MSTQIYIIIAIAALAVVFVILALKRKSGPKPLSGLAAAAFLLVLAGIFFSENRIAGYILIALGVSLAVADIFFKQKK